MDEGGTSHWRELNNLRSSSGCLLRYFDESMFSSPFQVIGERPLFDTQEFRGRPMMELSVAPATQLNHEQ